MESYDPHKPINSEEWLALDENERMLLVEDFHDTLDPPMDHGGLKIHCALHAAVENQLAEAEYPVIKQTLDKLVRQGLDRHDAIHAIASILGTGLFAAMQGSDSEFSIKNYRRKLDKLTAKRWRKGLV